MKTKSGRKDIVGKVFGRLTVVEYSHTKNKKAYWKCLCACGKECIVEGAKLRNGHTKSCGCLLKDINKSRTVNDEKRRKIYKVWSNMVNRCENAKNSKFVYYGARGITVCDEWKDFNKFYEWCMENGWEIDLTLDRKDNDLHYEPNNCRFISLAEQQRNKRNNLIIFFNGENKTITEWSRDLGVSRRTIKYWLAKYNGNGENAISTIKHRINNNLIQRSTNDNI